MAAHLYQLRSSTALAVGSYVAINGPWDTYGVVWKSEPTHNNEFLNLIKGVRKDPIKKPVYSW